MPGARPDFLQTYVTDGTMRNLALLAAGGIVPEYVVPIEPVLSHLNLTCLVSGSRPAVQGIAHQPDSLGSAELALAPPGPALWAWDPQGEDTRDAILFLPGADSSSAGNDLFISFEEVPAAGTAGGTALELHTIPAGLASDLNTAVGALPAAPDASSSVDAFTEAVFRRLDWQTRAAIWLWTERSPRTMVLALDMLSALADAGLLSPTDPYHAPTRAAYRRLDQALGELFAVVDMSQTVTVIGTTNGRLPYQRVLNLEAVLRAGLPDLPADSLEISAAGGTAFISIHPPAGSPPAVQAALLRSAEETLLNAVAGDKPAVQRAAVGSEARHMGWAGAGESDLMVEAAAGIALRAGDPSGKGRIWWEEEGLAEGYSAELPAMRGFFVLSGPGLTPFGLIGPVSLIDIAPTVGALLDLPIPASVQGRPLRELMPGNER